jgi:hypothetical protein
VAGSAGRVLRIPSGASLQGGRQLHEGQMPFAQPIPRQPLVVPVVAVGGMEPLAHPGRLWVVVDGAQGDVAAAVIGELPFGATHGVDGQRSSPLSSHLS